MEKPQKGYQERCYYHDLKDGCVSICQPKNGVCLTIDFDAEQLDCFVEWKMMGIRDYVLGLECGNCYPDGRNIMREKGILKFLAPDSSINNRVKISLDKTGRKENVSNIE